jgi:hypothetical protein
VKIAPFAFAALIAIGASACDPCSGIASCRVVPTVSATGQVIDYASGKSIAGATVSFTPTAAGAPGETFSGTTDGQGQFTLSGVVSTDGLITGDITVHAASFPAGYTVHGFQLRASRTRGDGVDFGRVLAQPYLQLLGQFQRRFTGVRLTGTVKIQRTGGATLPASSYTLTADSLGLFYLEQPAGSADSVVANVVLNSPDSAQAIVFSAASLPVIWRDQVPSINKVFSIGASLAYVVQAFHRGLDSGVPGVSFSWTRTGGIVTTPANLAALSNVIGLFSLQTQPATEGAVTGTIVMAPPAPWAQQVFPNVTLPTFDSDSLRLFAVYRYGAQAHYVGQLFDRGTLAPVPGVVVDFVPTGGVAAQPRTDSSNALGFFLIAPYTAQRGAITGNVVIHYKPPAAPIVVTGVTVQTHEDDTLRLGATYGVGPSLRYAGIVIRDDNLKPIDGAQITFQRTGGIAVTPDPFTSVSHDGGVFSLFPAPAADGSVQGTLRIHAPPLRDTTFVISMPTFLADTLRLFATFRIAP